MLSSKQTEYLSNCNHRWNIKIGATGSGKSWLDYAYVVPKRLTSLKNQGACVILGNTQGTANRNIIEPMRSIWGEKLIGTIGSDNAAMLFGQKVYVLGADNKKHVARIQGMTIEYAYGDEMTTWAEPVFQMLKSRLRCEHSYFDGTANPDTPLHYIKKFIDSDIDIFCQTSTIFDNPFLPKEFVENLCKEYEGTVYYDRFILGKWALAEGMIYPMHKDAIAEPPEDSKPSQYCLSIDYGTMNAFSAGLWGKYGDVWYRIDEYYYSGRDTGVQKTDEEYAVALDKLIEPIMIKRKEKSGSYFEKMETIIDPSAASFITLLRKKQWYKVTPADNSVLDGIRDTASAMQTGKIKIAPDCQNWLKEVQGYVWDASETEDKPIKINDHCLTGDTLVDTENGQIPIKDMVGTCGRVWSFNTETKKAELKPYRDCRMTQQKAQIYKITMEDGREIKCTAEHPILTTRGYVKASELTEKDEIVDVSEVIR